LKSFGFAALRMTKRFVMSTIGDISGYIIPQSFTEESRRYTEFFELTSCGGSPQMSFTHGLAVRFSMSTIGDISGKIIPQSFTEFHRGIPEILRVFELTSYGGSPQMSFTHGLAVRFSMSMVGDISG